MLDIPQKINLEMAVEFYASCAFRLGLRTGVSLRQMFERVYLQKASSAIASNCGPGSFGLLFMRRDDAEEEPQGEYAEHIEKLQSMLDIPQKINLEMAELGENLPSYANLIALADHFQVTLDYLMCRTTSSIRARASSSVSTRQTWPMKRDRFSTNSASPYPRGVCVVTRYFGGILLGAGGLTRAYGGTAKLALDAAGVSRMRRPGR